MTAWHRGTGECTALAMRARPLCCLLHARTAAPALPSASMGMRVCMPSSCCCVCMSTEACLHCCARPAHVRTTASGTGSLQLRTQGPARCPFPPRATNMGACAHACLVAAASAACAGLPCPLSTSSRWPPPSRATCWPPPRSSASRRPSRLSRARARSTGGARQARRAPRPRAPRRQPQVRRRGSGRAAAAAALRGMGWGSRGRGGCATGWQAWPPPAGRFSAVDLVIAGLCSAPAL